MAPASEPVAVSEGLAWCWEDGQPPETAGLGITWLTGLQGSPPASVTGLESAAPGPQPQDTWAAERGLGGKAPFPRAPSTHSQPSIQKADSIARFQSLPGELRIYMFFSHCEV